MRCSRCGNQLLADSEFCQYCGLRLDYRYNSKPGDLPFRGVENADPAIHSRKKKVALLSVLLVMIVTALFVLNVWQYINNGEKIENLNNKISQDDAIISQGESSIKKLEAEIEDMGSDIDQYEKIIDEYEAAAENSEVYTPVTVEELYSNPEQYNGYDIAVVGWIAAGYNGSGGAFDMILVGDASVISEEEVYTEVISMLSCEYYYATHDEPYLSADISGYSNRDTEIIGAYVLAYGEFSYTPNINYIYQLDISSFYLMP